MTFRRSSRGTSGVQSAGSGDKTLGTRDAKEQAYRRQADKQDLALIRFCLASNFNQSNEWRACVCVRLSVSPLVCGRVSSSASFGLKLAPASSLRTNLQASPENS